MVRQWNWFKVKQYTGIFIRHFIYFTLPMYPGTGLKRQKEQLRSEQCNPIYLHKVEVFLM